MSQNTMTTEAPATLSEKELFAEMRRMRFKMHTVTGKQFDNQYATTIEELLICPGAYGGFDDITEQMASSVFYADDPEEEMQRMIEDLEGTAREWKKACEAFRDFKLQRLIAQSDEETDAEAEERFKTKATYDREIAERNERELMAIIKECEARADREIG